VVKVAAGMEENFVVPTFEIVCKKVKIFLSGVAEPPRSGSGKIYAST
jgi:hypothetical protein